MIDTIIFFTCLECLFIFGYLYLSLDIYFLYILNFIYFYVLWFLFFFYPRSFFKCIPLLLLQLSLIYTMYNYFCYITNISDIPIDSLILIIVLLFTGFYNTYLLRSNIDIKPLNKSNFFESIINIITNPKITCIFFIIVIISLIIRNTVFTFINLSQSFDFFLIYLIIFSLWVPTTYISNKLVYYIFGVDTLENKVYFTLDNLNHLFITCLIRFSFKSLLLFVLHNYDILEYMFKTKLSDFKLPKINLIKPILLDSEYNGTVIGKELAYREVVVKPLLKPHKFYSIKVLIQSGYNYSEEYGLLTPKSYNLDYRSNVKKQLDDIKDVYIRVSKNGALKISYVKFIMSNHLTNKFKIPSLVGFDHIPKFNLMDYANFKHELYLSNKNPKLEAYTYGFMNSLLTEYFALKKGYVVVPQSKETEGEVDFLVKRFGKTVGVVESKALKGKYSFTDLYTQAIRYANNNFNFKPIYAIVNKGPYISFGIYYQDFHSSNSIIKYTFFDGYIGLEADKNLKVRPVPQKNSVELHHKLYKLSSNVNNFDIEQNRCVSSILEYMERNENIDLSKLDWGGKKGTTWDGGDKIFKR
uniref:Uncharacterized protein n=1 Tax=Pseudocercospora fijiensis TaxID=1873960 RepID=A0A516EZM1_9PEZI|nr:hypothetical protein [Pseudocercospora fijiensis]QDO71954.1 hypothetical protein [Pseudocercospora fijiensis]